MFISEERLRASVKNMLLEAEGELIDIEGEEKKPAKNPKSGSTDDALFSLEDDEYSSSYQFAQTKGSPPKHAKKWEKKPVIFIQKQMVRLLMLKMKLQLQQGVSMVDVEKKLLGKTGADGKWGARSQGLWDNSMGGKQLPSTPEAARALMKKDYEEYKTGKAKDDLEARWEGASITTNSGYYLRRERSVHYLLESEKIKKQHPDPKKRDAWKKAAQPMPGQSFARMSTRGIGLFNTYHPHETQIDPSDFVKMRWMGAKALGKFPVEFAAGYASNDEPGQHSAGPFKGNAVRLTFDSASDTLYVEIPEAKAKAHLNHLVIIPDPNKCVTSGTTVQGSTTPLGESTIGAGATKAVAQVQNQQSQAVQQTALNWVGGDDDGLNCEKMQALIDASTNISSAGNAALKFIAQNNKFPTKFKIEGCVYSPQDDSITVPQGSFYNKGVMGKRLKAWFAEKKRQDTVKKQETEKKYGDAVVIAEEIYSFFMDEGGGKNPIFDKAQGTWYKPFGKGNWLDDEKAMGNIWRRYFDNTYGKRVNELSPVNKKALTKYGRDRIAAEIANPGGGVTLRVFDDSASESTVTANPSAATWKKKIPRASFKT